jgi:hypothetical protein
MTDIVLKLGTNKVFQSSGGDAAITLTSLASNAARQSVKLDLGATFSARYACFMDIELTTAPTAGERVELWLAWSWTATAGSDNPGGVSGTDAAYKAAEEDEWKKQLDFAGSLIATADGSTVIQRQLAGIVDAKARYLSVVVVNKSGVAFHSTAANLRIVLVPLTDTTV